MGQHGYARVKPWELKEFAPAPDGSVSLRLRLPDSPEASSFPPCTVEYIITVSDSLTLQLAVTNDSPDEIFSFENCLHTYFEVRRSSLFPSKGSRVSYR
jgi:D-hexose-6-phosphate mutarotase